jgi:hypothetical protein
LNPKDHQAIKLPCFSRPPCIFNVIVKQFQSVPSIPANQKRIGPILVPSIMPTWAATRSVGLLMAPPDGGAEQGGLAERLTHPKPSGGRSAAPLPRRRALLGLEMLPDDDSNWDDGQRMEEEPGFRQGSEVQIGGTVDMEDDVYLEFDEEEDLKEAPST